jgi:hypothetical protein
MPPDLGTGTDLVPKKPDPTAVMIALLASPRTRQPGKAQMTKRRRSEGIQDLRHRHEAWILEALPGSAGEGLIQLGDGPTDQPWSKTRR